MAFFNLEGTLVSLQGACPPPVPIVHEVPRDQQNLTPKTFTVCPSIAPFLCALDGTPIKRGSIKLEEAVSIAASTVKDRLAALNFERVESGSATLFAHTRLPGEESTKGKDLPEYLQYATLLLPHAPAAEGLWANNLVSTGQLDFCTVLPHVEQHLMVSSSPLFILSPKLTIFNNTPAVEALEYAILCFLFFARFLPTGL